MNINRINSQKGIAQFLVIAVMAFLALGIPTATKLVQQNQENRSKATENTKIASEIKYDFNLDGKLNEKDIEIITNYIVSLPQNPYDINNDNQVDIMDITKLIDILNSGNGDIKKYDFNLDGKLGKEDVQVIQGYIVSLPQNPYDINNDNQVDTIDIVKLIKIINDSKTGSNNLPTKTPTPPPITRIPTPRPTRVPTAPPITTPTTRPQTGGSAICGPVNNTGKVAKPTTYLCSAGTASEVITISKGDKSYYSWTCKDISDGAIVNCSAEKMNKINCDEYYSAEGCFCNNGTVTYSHGNKFCSSETNTCMTCNNGKVLPSTGCLPSCNGIAPTEPVCGFLNNDVFYYFPQEEILCKVGKPSQVIISDKGNYYWDCNFNTKTIRCFTNPLETKLDGECGTASDQIVNSVPKDKELCFRGINSEITIVTEKTPGGRKFYKWTCTGLNGGTTANCTAIVGKISGEVTPTPPPISISGAYLYFSPQNQSRKIGDTFVVAVGINSGSNIIGGVDVVGTFDSSKLELISIKKSPSMVFGSKGDCTISKDLVFGKFSLSCYVNDYSQAILAKGELVYLILKAKSAGSAKIEFACEKNNLADSNIISSNPVQDIIVCDKNINANIVITGSTQTKIDGKCSSSLNKCLGGTFKDLSDTTTLLVWQCSGSNGGKSVKCSIKDNLTSGNGVCGDTTKIITNTCVSGSPIDLPDTLNEYVWECRGAKTTQRCVKIKGSDDDLCPKNQFNHLGKCENDLEIGWGCDRDGVCISGKCDLTTNRCVNQNSKIPATSIRISPLGLSLKVGQNRNLTYVLSPGSSTDTVKWSTTSNGTVRIQKITLKCANSPNTKCIDVPGINNLLITGLKSGTVKIKLTTSSGKTAQATVVVQK